MFTARLDFDYTLFFKKGKFSLSLYLCLKLGLILEILYNFCICNNTWGKDEAQPGFEKQ